MIRNSRIPPDRMRMLLTEWFDRGEESHLSALGNKIPGLPSQGRYVANRLVSYTPVRKKTIDPTSVYLLFMNDFRFIVLQVGSYVGTEIFTFERDGFGTFERVCQSLFFGRTV